MLKRLLTEASLADRRHSAKRLSKFWPFGSENEPALTVILSFLPSEGRS